MPSSYVYLILFAVAIVLLILVFDSGAIFPKSSNALRTTVPSNTASNSYASIPTTTVAVINYTTINIEYWYSGPSYITNNGNRTTCTYYNYTTIDSQAQLLNGSQSFIVVLNPSTSGCPITWRAISAVTPGFVVTSVVPSLPYKLPPNSTAQIQLNLKAPAYNFNGPLTIAIYQN